MKSEKVARKSPIKEKVKADAKEWIKQFLQGTQRTDAAKKGHMADEVQT